MLKITDKARVVVSTWGKKTKAHIREYYVKDGKEKPGKAGITFTREEWEEVKVKWPAIVEEIDRGFEDNG